MSSQLDLCQADPLNDIENYFVKAINNAKGIQCSKKLWLSSIDPSSVQKIKANIKPQKILFIQCLAKALQEMRKTFENTFDKIGNQRGRYTQQQRSLFNIISFYKHTSERANEAVNKTLDMLQDKKNIKRGLLIYYYSTEEGQMFIKERYVARQIKKSMKKYRQQEQKHIKRQEMDKLRCRQWVLRKIFDIKKAIFKK